MPLVVPGINSTGSKAQSSSEDWMSKLMGKKLGDSHNETMFARSDLPKESRVIGPGDMSTMDHKPERLNVHVDEDGTVRNVRYG